MNISQISLLHHNCQKTNKDIMNEKQHTIHVINIFFEPVCLKKIRTAKNYCGNKGFIKNTEWCVFHSLCASWGCLEV